MSRIITALFEDRGAAERALQALIETGTARDRIAIIGERHATGTEVAPTRPAAPNEDVVAALRDLALPAEDTRLFGEGLRRGCGLVSVRMDSGDVEQAVRVLEMFDPVDLDRRSEEWLRSGRREGVDVGGPLGAGLTAGAGAAGTSNVSATPGMGTMAQDTSSLGTADLRSSGTTATGDRRSDERAGAPGANELATAGIESPNPDLRRRETTGVGRVRRYVRDG